MERYEEWGNNKMHNYSFLSLTLQKGTGRAAREGGEEEGRKEEGGWGWGGIECARGKEPSNQGWSDHPYGVYGWSDHPQGWSDLPQGWSDHPQGWSDHAQGWSDLPQPL